jgi:hypothetical protein
MSSRHTRPMSGPPMVDAGPELIDREQAVNQ